MTIFSDLQDAVDTALQTIPGAVVEAELVFPDEAWEADTPLVCFTLRETQDPEVHGGGCELHRGLIFVLAYHQVEHVDRRLNREREADLVQKIKNALQSDPTLGGACSQLWPKAVDLETANWVAQNEGIVVAPFDVLWETTSTTY